MILPVYLMLLADSGSALRPIAVQQVLALASLDPVAFREVTKSLEPDQRTCLESALRGSIQSTLKPVASKASASPSIELKSFG